MEDIDNQISRLETLLAGIHIEEESDIENNVEENEVVLDYSSDENPYQENPYFVKTEDNPEGSNRKRSYDQRDYDDIRFREYLREHGYMMANEKIRKVSSEFIPKSESFDRKLNLDCVTDKIKTFLDWKNELELKFKLDPKLEELSNKDILSYITLQTTGIVHWYLAYLDVNTKESILSEHKDDVAQQIIFLLARQFLGKELKTDVGLETIQRENFWKITNLKICNMCYLENYICEFQKYYYLLKDERKAIADGLFFNKLPFEVGQEVEKVYQDLVNQNLCPETLGGKIDVLNQWVKEKCRQETSRKQAQIKLCCKKNDNIGNYGCNKTKRYKKKWKKIPYNKYKKQKYKPKFFRKRKAYRQKYPTKSKTCPTGKQKCRCWLCNEEGHYANKCPKKGQGKTKTETLRIAYDLGFEPIEDDMSDSEISIYGYETETDSEEE